MKRQAMTVSIEQLRVLANDLEQELKDLAKELGLKEIDLTQKFQINIINPQEECCDTWEIENQQPDVKGIAHRNGGGEYTDDGHTLKSGVEEGGTTLQYPPVDTDALTNPELDSVTRLDGRRLKSKHYIKAKEAISRLRKRN